MAFTLGRACACAILVVALTADLSPAAVIPIQANHVDTAFKIIGKFWPPAEGYYDKVKPFLKVFGVFESGPKSEQEEMLDALKEIDKKLDKFSAEFATFSDNYNRDQKAQKEGDILDGIAWINQQSLDYVGAVRGADGDLDKYLAQYASDPVKRDKNAAIAILKKDGISKLLGVVNRLSRPENLQYFQSLLHRSIVETVRKAKGVDLIKPYSAYNTALLRYDLALQVALEQAQSLERLALYLQYESPLRNEYGHLLSVGENFAGTGNTYAERVAKLQAIFDQRANAVHDALIKKAIDFKTEIPGYKGYYETCGVDYYDEHKLKARCRTTAGAEKETEIDDITKVCLQGGDAEWTNWDGILACRAASRLTPGSTTWTKTGTVQISWLGGKTFGVTILPNAAGSGGDTVRYEITGNRKIERDVSLVAAANGSRLELSYPREKGPWPAAEIHIKAAPNVPRKQGAPFVQFALRVGADTLPRLSLGCIDNICTIPGQEEYAATIRFPNDVSVRIDRCGDDPFTTNVNHRVCLRLRAPGWPGN